MVWVGLNLDLVVAKSYFQIGAQSPLEWDQMNLSSYLQLVVASFTSFWPFALSGKRSHECFPQWGKDH